jgi:23S rRNA (pseudouridine1915-N3)-methyltransferase
LHFVVIGVGTPKGTLAEAIEEYESRASRYWPLLTKVVKEEPARGDVETVRRKEGERILAAAGSARLVACTETGTPFVSRAFSRWMQESREAARDVAFVIGGANGLDASVTNAAQLQLSLAPWTMPHDLARLLLAEQLYRAGTLHRGEPYHK